MNKIENKKINEAEIDPKSDEKDTRLEHLENKLDEITVTIADLKTKAAFNQPVDKPSPTPSNQSLVTHSEILEATNELIREAIVSTLAQFAARQDKFEQKSEDQFGALEHQLGSLLAILQTKIPESPKYPCNICGNTFETERGMRNHTRTHQIT